MSSRQVLLDLLGPTLGAERSEEIVAEAEVAAGVSARGEPTPDQAEAILQHIEAMEGLVGITARRARRRYVAEVSSKQAPSGVRLADVETALAKALGDEKAHEAVASYAARAGIQGEVCTEAQALALFDAMAKAEGLLGVVARFAKARWYLRSA